MQSDDDEVTRRSLNNSLAFLQDDSCSSSVQSLDDLGGAKDHHKGEHHGKPPIDYCITLDDQLMCSRITEDPTHQHPQLNQGGDEGGSLEAGPARIVNKSVEAAAPTEVFIKEDGHSLVAPPKRRQLTRMSTTHFLDSHEDLDRMEQYQVARAPMEAAGGGAITTDLDGRFPVLPTRIDRSRAARRMSVGNDFIFQSQSDILPTLSSNLTNYSDDTVETTPEHGRMFSGSADQTTLSTQREGADRTHLSSKLRRGEQMSYLVDVERTRRQLLEQEDTDKNEQVTVEDKGPKWMSLGSASSEGFYRHPVRGTYQISNLLQELALLSEKHHRDVLNLRPSGDTELIAGRYAVIPASHLRENPVDRMLRLINMYFWPALVRRIDHESIQEICLDGKDKYSDESGKGVCRVYVPFDDPVAFVHYTKIAEEQARLLVADGAKGSSTPDGRQRRVIEVIRLPERPYTPQFVRSLDCKPGILSLALESAPDPKGAPTLRGVPFVVPGGRFNEMYGWDSYFISLGLLSSEGCCQARLEYLYLARCMVKNFCYEIKHYGKILNANRSYYLTRSQPPFLTDMALKVYAALVEAFKEKEKFVGHEIAHPLLQEEPIDFLRHAITHAIVEYEQVWTGAPRRITDGPAAGLSRYHDEGRGMPPETEPSHFDAVLAPFAAVHKLSLGDFIREYRYGRVDEPALDEYFVNDRAVRESGHDTTYRLEGVASHLATVDLNALLHKYEVDIAGCIGEHFGGRLEVDGTVHTPAGWLGRAQERRRLMDRLMWDPVDGLYYDYNFRLGQRSRYKSVTTLYPLWAGMCSPEQVEGLLSRALPLFEAPGGLVSGTEDSRGQTSLSRPTRQWDWPLGWVPHQMLAWEAIRRHAPGVSVRLAYRWLYLLTCSFADFNAVVPEKYDVVHLTHKLDHIEYGNVGTKFSGVPKEGFGWMNASYQVGLQYLGQKERRALGALISPDLVFGLTKEEVVRPAEAQPGGTKESIK